MQPEPETVLTPEELQRLAQFGTHLPKCECDACLRSRPIQDLGVSVSDALRSGDGAK